MGKEMKERDGRRHPRNKFMVTAWRKGSSVSVWPVIATCPKVY